MAVERFAALADSLLDENAEPERLGGGATWSEGPCWVPDKNALLWSDIPGNRILRWDDTDGVTVHREQVEFTNGRALDAAGRIVHCSHGRRAIERENCDGTATVLVDRFGSARLNSPNDLVVASDGAIWFSDPPYGIVQPHEGHPGEKEYGGCFVFRYLEATQTLQALITDIEEPNGLAFNANESILYVADTSAALRTDGSGNRHIVAYRVNKQWECERIGVFASCDEGLFDGFSVDEEGNVWTSAGAGVDVYAPNGQRLARIGMPAAVGNVCFGGQDGRDLFIACSDAIWRLRTKTRDAKSHCG